MDVVCVQMPSALARLERRFAAWRKGRTIGERIPERLWRAAADVAVAHG